MLHHPAHFHGCSGQYGNLVGTQTVPRAECTALIRLLQYLVAPPIDTDGLDVHTDSKIVYDGYQCRQWHSFVQTCIRLFPDGAWMMMGVSFFVLIMEQGEY